MVTTSSDSSSYAQKMETQCDPERELVACMLANVSRDGLSVDSYQLVNLYVALKSKPIVILAGPKFGGKTQAVRSMARVLTGGEIIQFQEMNGHAWWAARSENLSEFTLMQERFISEKICALLYEACNPDHFHQTFILLINHMSLGELDGLFIDLAFQLKKGELNCLLSESFSIPFPFPPNLHAIGTIDRPLFDWFNNETLLSQATVIHWRAFERSGEIRSSAPYLAPQVDANRVDTDHFLRVKHARIKLGKILAWRDQKQPTLIHLVGWLLKHDVKLPSRVVMDEAMVYLANAFSDQGVGLFVPEASQNLQVALDFVLAQIVLPRAWKSLRHSTKLREILRDQLVDEFPRAVWILDQSKPEMRMLQRSNGPYWHEKRG